MRTEGNAAAYVAGATHVPLPRPDPTRRSVPQPDGYLCPTCGWRAKRAGFHICIDPAKPAKPAAPVTAPAKPAAKKPAAKKRTTARPLWAERAEKARVGRGAGGGVGNKGGTVTARIDEVMQRYAAGDELKTIADDLGVTPNAVGQALKRRGVTLRSSAETQRGKPRYGQRALDEQQSAECAALYRGGMSMLNIARHFEVSENGVRETLKRLGVPSRPAGRRSHVTPLVTPLRTPLVTP